ncbi:MAG TPA: c-type cytochrome [Terriglobales bacterium]|jgi:cytochrome c2|nr:c-type cytochrome [Terriglobales bacterium]
MKTIITSAMWGLLLVVAACSKSRLKEEERITGGDPVKGKEDIVRYGCPACHEIPDIPTARSRVGPSLRNIVAQQYLAGQLPNTPDNMARWIRTPQEIRTNSTMPDLGLSDEEARDITAYLYSLP